jgi:hypothetical protein
MNANRTMVIDAWLLAGRELGIQVVAPFTFEAEGQLYPCLAWLPDFGGGDGTLVAEIGADRDLLRAGTLVGRRCSFVNPGAYRTFERDHFIETLLDWGFSGPPQRRPTWLDEPLAVEHEIREAAERATQEHARDQGWQVEQTIPGRDVTVSPSGQRALSMTVILQDGSERCLEYRRDVSGVGQIAQFKGP